MAVWLGWLAVVTIVLAASLPVGTRITRGKRSPPDSQPIRIHVVLGTTTAVLAFLHTLTILPNLGSSEAVGGGFWAMTSGAIAFCILVAHAGIGLQLRNLRLRNR